MFTVKQVGVLALNKRGVIVLLLISTLAVVAVSVTALGCLNVNCPTEGYCDTHHAGRQQFIRVIEAQFPSNGAL